MYRAFVVTLLLLGDAVVSALEVPTFAFTVVKGIDTPSMDLGTVGVGRTIILALFLLIRNALVVLLVKTIVAVTVIERIIGGFLWCFGVPSHSVFQVCLLQPTPEALALYSSPLQPAPVTLHHVSQSQCSHGRRHQRHRRGRSARSTYLRGRGRLLPPSPSW